MILCVLCWQVGNKSQPDSVSYVAPTIIGKDTMSFRPWRTNISEIMLKIQNFSFMTMYENIVCEIAAIKFTGIWVKNPAYIHIKQRTELSEYIVLYGIL